VPGLGGRDPLCAEAGCPGAPRCAWTGGACAEDGRRPRDRALHGWCGARRRRGLPRCGGGPPAEKRGHGGGRIDSEQGSFRSTIRERYAAGRRASG
jgi:hypothetical protein